MQNVGLLRKFPAVLPASNVTLSGMLVRALNQSVALEASQPFGTILLGILPRYIYIRGEESEVHP